MNIMHLSREEYRTLSTTGTLTKGGVTYTFDPTNTEYVVPDHLYLHTMTGTAGPDIRAFHGTIKVVDKNPTPYLFNTFEHPDQATITTDILAKAVLVGGEVIETGNTLYTGAFNILPNGTLEVCDRTEGNVVVTIH